MRLFCLEGFGLLSWKTFSSSTVGSNSDPAALRERTIKSFKTSLTKSSSNWLKPKSWCNFLMPLVSNVGVIVVVVNNPRGGRVAGSIVWDDGWLNLRSFFVSEFSCSTHSNAPHLIIRAAYSKLTLKTQENIFLRMKFDSVNDNNSFCIKNFQPKTFGIGNLNAVPVLRYSSAGILLIVYIIFFWPIQRFLLQYITCRTLVKWY